MNDEYTLVKYTLAKHSVDKVIKVTDNNPSKQILSALREHILLLNTVGNCPHCLEKFKVSIKENKGLTSELTIRKSDSIRTNRSHVYIQQSNI